MCWQVVLVLQSAYLASTAVFMVSHSAELAPDTFSAFLSPNLRVCVLDGSAYSNFMANHKMYKYLTQVTVLVCWSIVHLN